MGSGCLSVCFFCYQLIWHAKKDKSFFYFLLYNASWLRHAFSQTKLLFNLALFPKGTLSNILTVKLAKDMPAH